MAASFFAQSSKPVADNSSTLGGDVTNPQEYTIIPPGSMTSAMLVFVTAAAISTGGAFDVSNTTTGGQTWNALTVHTNDAVSKSLKHFWCQFNGTWAADPVFLPNSAGNFVDYSLSMLVFSPTNGTATWAVDVAESATAYTAPGSPFDVTTTGQTVLASSAVTIASYSAIGTTSPTWATQSGGSGWTHTTTNQLRNTYSTGISLSHLYKIGGAGATGNVTNRQNATGFPGWKTIVTFKETLSGGSAFPTMYYRKRRS